MTIIKQYEKHLHEKGKRPKSFSKFIRKYDLENKENFTSFDELEKEIWRNFSLKTQKEIDQIEEYTAREKTLAYFYSLIEELSENEKIISILNSSLKSKKNIFSLQKEYTIWTKTNLSFAIENNEIVNRPFISEKYIYLFNLLLAYVLRIHQKNEQQVTEIAIEKSVNLLFDILKSGTLDSAIDFGKFIIQNKAF